MILSVASEWMTKHRKMLTLEDKVDHSNQVPVSLPLAVEPASFSVAEPSCDSVVAAEPDASCTEVDQEDLDYREEVEIDPLERHKRRSIDSASLASSVAYHPFVLVVAVAVAVAAAAGFEKLDRLDRQLVESSEGELPFDAFELSRQPTKKRREVQSLCIRRSDSDETYMFFRR